MVNLLHARVVFEHLNIEHANCRIVALSQCRKLLPVAMSPCRQTKFAFVILSSVIRKCTFEYWKSAYLTVLKISNAYCVTSTA